MTDTKARIEVSVPGVKEKMLDWITNRGGVAIWTNINLSNCDAGDHGHHAVPLRERIQRSETLSRRCAHGRSVHKVHGRGDGLSIKCTDGATRKIRKMCAKYSNDQAKAVYRFDYDTQEAVIELPVWED